MTGMLASVRDGPEAELALSAGADIIDLKDPGSGALGTLPGPVRRAVVDRINGRVPVSATVGDLPFHGDGVRAAVLAAVSDGVDIVKVGVFGAARPEGRPVEMLGELCRGATRIVLVLFAENYAGADFRALRAAGIAGVMIDTMEKHSGSLTGKLGLDVLADFVGAARDAGLMTGLAGSLRAQDVGLLVPLRPDYLGFRGALCAGTERDAALDGQALARIAGAMGRRQRGPVFFAGQSTQVLSGGEN